MKTVKNSAIYKLLSVLFLASFIASCGGGGGAGSPTVSSGTGAGTVTSVSLFTNRVAASSTDAITLEAVLTDGNGQPVVGRSVAFHVTSGPAVITPQIATTNEKGIAIASLRAVPPPVTASSLSTASVLSGIVTVLASADGFTGAKTVYFVNGEVRATLFLIPDGNGNGAYGETGDYSVIADGISAVSLMAIFSNAGGLPEAGRYVTFGSDSTDVTFSKNPAMTDSFGQALTKMTVLATSGSQVITIYAYEQQTGAADMISVFSIPITATSLTLTASDSKVETTKEVDIKACVTSTTGNPMPDGTLVRYSPTTMGIIDEMFGSTVNGCHKTKFTAGSVAGAATLTAVSGGVSGSYTITITNPVTPLVVTPTEGSAATGASYAIAITGGTPPYKATASPSTATVSPSTVSASGGVVSVTDSTEETATVTVTDAAGQVASASVTFTAPPPGPALLVTPASGSVKVGLDFSIAITGGTPPYSVMTNPSTAVATPATVTTSGGIFSVTDSVAEVAIVTVIDAASTIVTATVTFTP